MKSTGEVMGGGATPAAAYARAVRAAGRGKARAAVGPSLQKLAEQPETVGEPVVADDSVTATRG